MNWLEATDAQIKSIVEDDGGCPPHLLKAAMEEAVRRDLYHNYIVRILNSRFKAIKYAEYLTKLTLEEIKYMCYWEAFRALNFFKPGKCGFIKFWVNFIHTALNDVTRKYRAKKRVAEFAYLDEDEEERIQLVADHNTERKAINRVYIEQLFRYLTKRERTVILQYGDYTFAEIASEMGLSRETVRKTYYGAIKKLREIGA